MNMNSVIKCNKVQAVNLWQLYRGGAHATSEWTNGRGRNTTKKAVPPFCERIARYQAARHPKRIRQIFEKRPRVQEVVAITNMRAAKNALRQHGLID